MNVDMHHMTLVGRSTSGEEAWVCPDCDRRLLVAWTPQFHRTVLAVGDDTVQHAGGKGGAAFSPVDVTRTPTSATLAWLHTNGISWDDDVDPPEARSA